MTDQEIRLTFWDHVDELRATLIKVLSIIAVGTIITLLFFPKIFQIITLPLSNVASSEITQSTFTLEKLERIRIHNISSRDSVYHLPKRADHILTSSYNIRETAPLTYYIPSGEYLEYDIAQPSAKLILLSPSEGLLTTIKTSFWIGLVATSPLWLFFILQFIAPALGGTQRKLIYPFIGLSMCSIALGFAFAFYITIPLANVYLAEINQSLGQNLWSLSQYVSYSFLLLFANGIAFESSVILFFLIHYGMISAPTLKKHRRGVIVGIFVASAILTPPDVLTQILLAIPLMIIFEATIFYAQINSKSLRNAKVAKRSTQ
jgi:sec-independent protein translocase protein TatC